MNSVHNVTKLLYDRERERERDSQRREFDWFQECIPPIGPAHNMWSGKRGRVNDIDGLAPLKDQSCGTHLLFLWPSTWGKSLFLLLYSFNLYDFNLTSILLATNCSLFSYYYLSFLFLDVAFSLYMTTSTCFPSKLCFFFVFFPLKNISHLNFYYIS